MKTSLVIFSSMVSVLFASCAHEAVETGQSNSSFRKWEVGPTQGQIKANKKFALNKISAEMECIGSTSDGSEWKETKELRSKMYQAKSTSKSKEITYDFVADAETIIIPEGQLKSCTYFIKTEGPHPNGGIGSGRFPVAGDMVDGMSDLDLDTLLNNRDLNLEINKALAGLKISH